MSRYVRTCNGYRSDIIDLDREVYGRKVIHYNEGELEADSPAGFYWPETEETGFELECRDEDIIKRADTIEELCDEFVCTGGKGRNSFLSPEYKNFDEEGYPTDTYEEGLLNAIRRGVNYINYVWYGAVWDCRGLIYVAKINKKGEFELL